MVYQLFADGSCQPNPGAGGWAFILQGNDIQIIKTGGRINTTNNRMELTAVLEGLKCYIHNSQNEELHIISDSKYVLKGIAKWSKQWIARDWRKYNGRPVMNDDLWKSICDITENLNITCIYIKGHSGHEKNGQCDELAQRSARKIKENPKMLYFEEEPISIKGDEVSLAEIIARIHRLEPLETDKKTQELLDNAVDYQHACNDSEAWASQLADDVKDAND